MNAKNIASEIPRLAQASIEKCVQYTDVRCLLLIKVRVQSYDFAYSRCHVHYFVPSIAQTVRLMNSNGSQATLNTVVTAPNAGEVQA